MVGESPLSSCFRPYCVTLDMTLPHSPFPCLQCGPRSPPHRVTLRTSNGLQCLSTSRCVVHGASSEQLRVGYPGNVGVEKERGA